MTRTLLRAVATVLLAGAVLLGPGWVWTPSAADAPVSDATEESLTVSGRLIHRAEGEAAPVADATITITDVTGRKHVTISDNDGSFAVRVPYGEGLVRVELDEATLPDGVSLRDDADATLERRVSGTLPITVVYLLGAGNSQPASWAAQVPQTLYNGLYFGVVIALGALGLSLIFGTTRLTNFAHGELVTLGALLTYAFNVAAGLDIWVAVPAAVAVAGLFGLAQERFFWRPIRRRGTGPVAMMIISIGVLFILRYSFQFLTGGRTETYRQHTTPQGHRWWLVTFTVRDVVCVVVAAVLLLTVTVALKRSRLGRAVRAVADNAALAATSGIHVDRVVALVWSTGALLAGACGALLGFSQAVKFDLGALHLLVMFAAITVGGLGSVWGAIAGSLLVGTLIELSTIVMPAELKVATALLLLVAVLLVRPQGLLGRPQRVG